MYKEQMRIPPISSYVGHGYLQHGFPERKRSEGLSYYVYFIRTDVEHRDAISFAFGDFLPVGIFLATTKPDWVATKVVKRNRPAGEELEINSA